MNSLAPAEFERLLTRINADRNRAAEGYELLRRKLVLFFERTRCTRPDELADETIDRVATRLGAEEIRDLNLFAYGVARKVCLEVQRKQGRFIPLDPSEDQDRLAVDVDSANEIIEQLSA